jgi:Holliday junction resolvase RusA-like endonuclease
MSTHLLSFWVPGIPAPGGSKKTIRSKRTGAISVIDDAMGNAEWRRAVRAVARENMKGRKIAHGPLVLMVSFYMPRPDSHYIGGRRGNGLKPDAATQHITKPDALKLMRSTEDAMTRVVWVDDSQVVRQVAAKYYVDEPSPGNAITSPGAFVEIHTDGDEN